MKFILIAVLASLLSPEIFACKITAQQFAQYATSLPDEKSFAYGEKQSLRDFPHTSASECIQAAMNRKFLMIAVGPVESDVQAGRDIFSFNGEWRDSTCRLKPNPFEKEQNFEERHAYFKEHDNYIRSCMQIYVEHSGSASKLQYTEKQPGCEILKVTDQSAALRGGFCFLKPAMDSTYFFRLEIRKECRSVEGLKRLGLRPMDVRGVMNFYLSGDESGQSMDLKALSSLGFRVSTNPLKEMMKVSDDYGLANPIWPSEWHGADVQFSQPALSERGEKDFYLKLPLIVDNRCARKCVSGLCSGPCDYSLPIAPAFSLYNLKGEKKILIKSWRDGGIAQSNWQGVLNVLGTNIPKSELQEGDSYLVEAIVGDPKIDYTLFRNLLVKRINVLITDPGSINRDAGEISPINEIPQIDPTQNLPEIEEIGGLRLGSSLDGVQASLRDFLFYLNTALWPPFYEAVCDSTMMTCSRKLDDHTKLKLFFQIQKTEKENGNEYVFKNLKFVRESSIMKGIESRGDLPKVICE